jgi:hypothetical protein
VGRINAQTTFQHLAQNWDKKAIEEGLFRVAKTKSASLKTQKLDIEFLFNTNKN